MEFQQLSASARDMFDDSLRQQFETTFKPNNQSFDAQRILKRLQGRFNEWRDPNRTLDEYYFASDSNVVLYRSNRKTKERFKVRICVPLELRVDVLIAEHIMHHGDPYAERVARKYKGITLQQAQWIARHCSKCTNTKIVRGLILKEAGVHLMRRGPARVAEQVGVQPHAKESDTIHRASAPDDNEYDGEETEEDGSDDDQDPNDAMEGSSILENQAPDMGLQGAAQWGSLRAPKPQFQEHQQQHQVRETREVRGQRLQEARQIQEQQLQQARQTEEQQRRESRQMQVVQPREHTGEYEIERLVAHRNVLSHGKITTEYLARWKGLGEAHDKWYKKQDLEAAPLLVQEYDIRYLAEQKRLARNSNAHAQPRTSFAPSEADS